MATPAFTEPDAPLPQILVSLDGSAFAEAAIPPALALAAGLDAGLTLLHVVPYPLVVAPFGWGPPPVDVLHTMHESAVAGAQVYLQQVRDRLHTTGLPVQIHLGEHPDQVAAAICAAARAPAVQAIAMATHGHGGPDHRLWGSVAEAVLPTTPVPLLVVRSLETERAPYWAPVLPYRRFLVPLDGSAEAEAALPVAQQIAGRTPGQILLLSIVADEETNGAEPSGTEATVREPGLAPRATAYLDGIADRLRAAGVLVEVAVATGDPAHEIPRWAAAMRVDLIVMSTHGRRGLARWRLGSVAARVVRGSAGPVLLVRVAARPRVGF